MGGRPWMLLGRLGLRCPGHGSRTNSNGMKLTVDPAGIGLTPTLLTSLVIGVRAPIKHQSVRLEDGVPPPTQRTVATLKISLFWCLRIRDGGHCADPSFTTSRST